VVTGASAGLGAQLGSVETVSRPILAQAGGPSLEISVSGMIDAATVFRSVLPGTDHRLRRSW